MSGEGRPRCTLVCLVTGEIAKPGVAALSLVRLFGRSCQLLLVSPIEDDLTKIRAAQSGHTARAEKHLTEHSDRAGVKTEMQYLSFTATLQHVAELEQNDILIVAQPAHPLDRQTLSFTALSQAALNARAATLYVPPGDHTKKSDLFVVEANDNLEFTERVKTVAEARKMRPKYLETYISFAEIKSLVTYLQPSKRPALLIVAADWLAGQPYSASRLAASLETPVLILGDENLVTDREALHRL